MSKIDDLERRLDEMHQDILDLRADLESATQMGRDLSNNVKYQTEMERVERRLKNLEDHLEL